MRRQILALTLLSACASCGTLINGGADVIEVRSVPAGAAVFRDGERIGVTPCVMKVDRGHGNSYALALSLDGHRTVHRKVSAESNPWMFGNLLLGPAFLVGFTIDVIGRGSRAFPDAIETIYLPPGEGDAYWADNDQLRLAHKGKIPGARLETFTAQDGTRATVLVRATTLQKTEIP